MEYNHKEIESRWQRFWKDNKVYHTDIDPERPKFYVLDMFPYPSGAGLHVGHPLGYIASDIFARYKRLNGFNVLHPMGYDAYGLPAEQYAIQTGQHPEKTTSENIARYHSQLDRIGFCYDWDREIRTCDPGYYHWTQWAFTEMFNHYYDTAAGKALPVADLVKHFEEHGSEGIHAAQTRPLHFTAAEWKAMDEKQRSDTLMNYRIAYLGNTMVNWCPKLGTVLANDEVSEGVSIRGGYPVEQKLMYQWCLRVSAYAQRLLDGLDRLEWSDSIKETQRNWIGRSEGAELQFKVAGTDVEMTIFTTRADTVFGVTFMVLAPESKYVDMITTPEQKAAVEAYRDEIKHKTERERIADRKVSGVFTGAYAVNPLTGKEIPVWVSDYVLAGYGTGAIMAVPAHDSRDYAFARKFDLPIVPLIEGADVSEESFDAKEGRMINSASDRLDLNGLTVKEAIAKTKKFIEAEGLGRVKVNYRLRDAIFSRQRYWGEPFPVYYKDGVPHMLPADSLPLLLPEIDKYLPTETGEPPLGRAKNWCTPEGYPLELNTMPGFAGSSAYYLRYMDPHNGNELVSPEANGYWQQGDLYVGGTEHATGHLIYSRFWNKFLYDLGKVVCDEPFRKLVNQGMIQGRSNFVYRIKDTNTFVTLQKKDEYDTTPIHVDVNIVSNDRLDLEAFRRWRPDYADAEFILDENGEYVCGWAVEKMSKSMFNVVNPDDIIERYGADTLRLYEMFLGPVEQSKPWDTNGIDGVNRFLRKFWGLFWKGDQWLVTDEKASAEALKAVHTLIKKVTGDIENFSYNTSVAAFMICINDLAKLNCHSAEALAPIVVLLAPFAPHMAEQLWHDLAAHNQLAAAGDSAAGETACGDNACAESTGETSFSGSVCDAPWPAWNEEYLKESQVKMPVSFNGKTRFMLSVAPGLPADEVEKLALGAPEAAKWLEGKTLRKVIVVPNKIVNIVLA